MREKKLILGKWGAGMLLALGTAISSFGKPAVIRKLTEDDLLNLMVSLAVGDRDRAIFAFVLNVIPRLVM